MTLRFRSGLQGILAHRLLRQRHQQLPHFHGRRRRRTPRLSRSVLISISKSPRICATAKTRISRRRSIANLCRRRAALPATLSCRARSCHTTISPMRMPRGNASRPSSCRPASSSSMPIPAAWPRPIPRSGIRARLCHRSHFRFRRHHRFQPRAGRRDSRGGEQAIRRSDHRALNSPPRPNRYLLTKRMCGF